MVISCPMCGKLTAIFWPQHWVFRRGETYYCSEDCLMVDLVKDTKMLNNALRKRRFNKSMNAFITDKQRDEAVRIVLEGGDPRPFLTECGSKSPEKMWSFIKNRIKEEDPELWAKLPARINGKKTGPKPKAPELPPAIVKVTGPIRIETPESNQVQVVETPEKTKAVMLLEGQDCSAVRDKNLGEFYYDLDHNCIDWRNGVGDEVSLGISGWKLMVERLPGILKNLGVEV